MTQTPRVVSLLSSNTEILCALGREHWLVGRSHECDFPDSVLKLPACSRARVDPSRSSSEIDRQVKSALREGLSLYEVRRDLLIELKPDFVLTQAQCEVCAVSLADVEQALCEDLGFAVEVISVAPNNLQDIFDSILTLGDALGLGDQAKELVGKLKDRVSQVARRAAVRVAKPKVFCMEWIDPLMAAGNWVPELVELAGGIPVGGEAGKHSPWFEWEDLLSHDPDLIVVCPCGFDADRARTELEVLSDKPEWNQLRAVREGQVRVVDGNQFFNRPGPRIVDSLELLESLLHPDS